MMYESAEAKEQTEKYFWEYFDPEFEEPIPTRKLDAIKNPPIIWRYFLQPKMEKQLVSTEGEEDLVIRTVMEINRNIAGAFVASSGKNMGIFKGVGYPEEIAEFFRLEEYRGHIWTAHGRFPTNTSGGGEGPIPLDFWIGPSSQWRDLFLWINRRYLLHFGYNCCFQTDTEVITYFFDLLHRRHQFDFPTVAKILAAPLWDEIERSPEKKCSDLCGSFMPAPC